VDLDLAIIRKIALFIVAFALHPAVHAQDMTLSIDQNDFIVTNVFSDVDTFSIDIQFAVPLSRGSFVDPGITNVTYRVSGDLVPGTPSGFPAFALERIMTGDEFYAQGSSISFEVAANAVLSDGVQVVELVGNGLVFTFNGKEIDNGRFHPTLFELNSDGTGLMQNSDNIIVLDPLQQIAFGSEYINTLAFDPGNTTLMRGITVNIRPPRGGNGGGALSFLALAGLFLLVAVRRPA
jgi:hypothetical protein